MTITPAVHTQSRRSGFTLVEVAIALAIFVIGALAIVRIFPGALSVVQNSGDRLAAVNLNRALLASYNNNPAWVPDGIYDTGSSPWAAPYNTGSTVGSMSRNNALPRTGAEDDYGTSALGHYRRIQGEKYQLGLVVNSMMTRFPYTGDVAIYTEDEVEGVTTDNDGYLDFANATWRVNGVRQPFPSQPITTPAVSVPGTGFQYDNGSTVTDTTYYISYRYLKNSRIWGISDEPVRHLTTNAGASQLRQGALAADSVVPGTVKVRMRRLVALHNPVSPDDSMAGFIDLDGYNDTTYALPLNPRQHISLDYTVRDWRWIVTDTAPKSNPDQTEATTILPIRNLDDGQNKYVYTILTDSQLPLTAATPTPVPVIGSYGEGQTPTGQITRVERKTSEVTFNTTNMLAPRSRVVFRTLDNWTQQVSVAARSYLPYDDAYSYENWRTYRVETASGNTYLYFPASEAGKTVAVTYGYQDGTNEILMERNLLPVDDTLLIKPVAFGTGFEPSGFMSRVELLNRQGDPIPGANLNFIRAVEGSSVQVRAAWQDGDRYSQNSIMGTRRLN